MNSVELFAPHPWYKVLGKPAKKITDTISPR